MRNLLLENDLEVDRDGDVVAERESAGLECRVPADAEVLAVDLGGRGHAGAHVAVRVVDDAADFTLQGDRQGDAAQGEVADEGEVVAVDGEVRAVGREQ